jgi:RNA polymerase sigma factor (sigma-70 family)
MLDVPRPRHDPEPGDRPPDADFETFYLTHRRSLFRALVVVTRDVHQAEEVMQDAFLRLWERWDRLGEVRDLEGYLYRTALNGWFQRGRRVARAARRVILVRPVLDPLEAVDDRDLLSRRLLELPERQRAALVLMDYLSYGSEEAARVLGIRPGTVRRLASQARSSLRRHDEEGGIR